jgi:hypothetical protein
VEACALGKHFKKLPSVFGEHLIYVKILPQQKKRTFEGFKK